MDLREAYRELEVAIGADEATARDAKKLLSKVWHPDKHATDPTVLAKAQSKLRTVNEAFELIRAAGFPAADRALPEAKAPRAPAVSVTQSAPAAAPTGAPITPPASPEPPVSRIEVVGTRRLRAFRAAAA